MFPLTTKDGGMCFAFPDVCKTPAPPAPPVPIPYPNMGQVAQADGGTCTSKVKCLNKPLLVKSSTINRSQGDEAGTLGGMVSNVNMDKVAYKDASTKVKAEGTEVVMHLKPTGQNGSNANMPAGTQVAPSQMKVIIGS